MSWATDPLRLSREPIQRALEEAGAKVGEGRSICCPFCDDKHPSAWIYESKDGVWRFQCHGKCKKWGDFYDVTAFNHHIDRMEAIAMVNGHGTTFTPGPLRGTLDELIEAMPGIITAKYDYGTGLVVCRIQANSRKSFRPIHQNCTSWVMGAPPKPWPIYAQRHIEASNWAVVVEGETCAQHLIDLGIPATTSPFGAGKASEADWSPLAGKRVCVWPDNDGPGMAHGWDVVQRMKMMAATIRWVNPMTLGLPKGGDVVDYTRRGGDPWRVLRASEDITSVELST